MSSLKQKIKDIEKTDVNVEDISIGIGLDKRIGSRFLRVGPAYGGSCFPKDTKAIAFTANKLKVDLSIIKSVIKSNIQRRKLLTNRVQKILMNKVKKDKNVELGKSRGEEIRKFLNEVHLVPLQQMHSVGYADDQPLANNSTPEGRKRNRRVDIVLLDKLPAAR